MTKSPGLQSGDHLKLDEEEKRLHFGDQPKLAFSRPVCRTDRRRQVDGMNA
ncbi:hypothetical protein [Anabaenopsis elenkinii]|uniref:Uncharacterized protein n=1 Tax=Anabaenopsis elenkinii CCIBt3563 TaxID=2779889 RepID=A0A7S6RG47_9CYAN|nr:hypothetical protein [Anabaenopsis elenkinii]QOV24292.1 hypothetical protein IM676_08680 [Anabaenopsis elenkinii CCIBt3563]